MSTEKDETIAVENIEESKIDETPTDEPQPRRRGRPRGSTASKTAAPRKTAQRKQTDVKALGRQIVGVHAIIAMTTGIPELQLQEKDGEVLADALVAVCDEYGFELSGKTGAAIQLFAAAGMIYAPRLLFMKARIDKEREARKASEITDVQFMGDLNNGVPQN